MMLFMGVRFALISAVRYRLEKCRGGKRNGWISVGGCASPRTSRSPAAASALGCKGPAARKGGPVRTPKGPAAATPAIAYVCRSGPTSSGRMAARTSGTAPSQPSSAAAVAWAAVVCVLRTGTRDRRPFAAVSLAAPGALPLTCRVPGVATALVGTLALVPVTGVGPT